MQVQPILQPILWMICVTLCAQTADTGAQAIAELRTLVITKAQFTFCSVAIKQTR
jgi:hypothetical protein